MKKSFLLSLLHAFVLALATSFFFACAKQGANPYLNNGSPRWGSFPVELYAGPEIEGSANRRDDLMQALAFWENRAGKQLFDYRGSWNGALPPVEGSVDDPTSIYANVILFHSPWTYNNATKGKTTLFSRQNTIFHSFILIKGDEVFCEGLCTNNPTQRTSQRRLFAHEIGHFLGLMHNENENDLMNANLSPDGDLDAVVIDQAALEALTR